MTPDLFSPIQFGACRLKSRIFMAPLTRSRAGKGNVPRPLNALYYAQRGDAGLIITEATQVSATAQGYILTPGIHTAEQVEGVEESRQRGSRCRGAHLCSAVARWSDLASIVPARRRSADQRKSDQHDRERSCRSREHSAAAQRHSR
jgi:hypothetical protein